MKKGFVMLETIIVLSVLCIILIGLYGGYVSLIKNAKASMYYDNTEYLYKTYILGKHLQKNIIDEGSYTCANCTEPLVFCNTLISDNSCEEVSLRSSSNPEYEYLYKLINQMKVQAIYISKWDTSTIIDNPETLSIFEASVQRYLKQLNPVKKSEDSYRIIVMYQDENNFKENTNEVYQFASVEFNSEKKNISVN